jgi:hypothetical protein
VRNHCPAPAFAKCRTFSWSASTVFRLSPSSPAAHWRFQRDLPSSSNWRSPHHHSPWCRWC